MKRQFRNLVFEGGGVKGIAYVGALEVLQKKGILKDIKRVGGTSAGAINALLLALGYSNADQLKILKALNFKNFMDEAENKRFLRKYPKSSRYVYNRQTLGFRLDTKQEIAVFRYGREPKHEEIDDFFDYVTALITTIIESQATQHLHGDDWQRTVYINTLGVRTTDFGVSQAKKKALIKSGRRATQDYFRWFENPNSSPVNRAVL